MSILKNLKKKHNISVNFFSQDAMQPLTDYSWPGNVRELENTLERVVLIHDKPIIVSDDIKYILDENSHSADGRKITQEEQQSATQPPVDHKKIQDDKVVEVDLLQDLDPTGIRTLKELEYAAIVKGLERTNWNMTTTAQQLGISRMTLYRKLDQHGLRKKD